MNVVATQIFQSKNSKKQEHTTDHQPMYATAVVSNETFL